MTVTKRCIIEHLEKWYKWLGLMGYSISDEEKAMLDGTHECFGEEEDENQ